MKTLYLIRHGLSQHNVLFQNFGKEIFYDKKNYDTKLVELGHEQSKQLGEDWKDKHKIDLVLVSSLTRTLETATNIFKDRNVPMIALDCLKEYPQGLHTVNKRSTKDILQKEFPKINFSYVISNEDDTWNPMIEEDLLGLNKRIEYLRLFLLSRKENNIAIVSHNSFIGQLKDKKISLIENGDTELKYCYPYQVKFENIFPLIEK